MSIKAMQDALEAMDNRDYKLADQILCQAIEDAANQEPVALETVYETIIHWDEGGGKRSRRELARRIEALYTHPQPKRKPLTDGDFLDWYDSAIWGNEDFKECCRIAFEAGWQAAHGIKAD